MACKKKNIKLKQNRGQKKRIQNIKYICKKSKVLMRKKKDVK